MASEFACFLVIHGSPDPRPQAALDTLIERHRADFAFCGGGALECQPLSLAEQLVIFGQRALTLELRQVRILPLFLLPGVHVQEDIPAAVAEAQQLLPEMQFSISPHLGSSPEMLPLVQQAMQQATATRAVDRWILLSHGSRRPSANQPVEILAQQLGATPAYWSVPPLFGSVLAHLSQSAQSQHLGVLTYFLFPGTITDTIQSQLPTDVVMTEPLYPTATLIRNLASRELVV
ncbi:sirohydrochlorin chelatase [Leptolyngbya sp. FACHB-261]|uniref:sirohydrochlorin chelatase n=1 Tax=Leptolyngbya sp. FACHB-261 TaxID=2692806 RepID=UPI00168951A2|nr:CbiX/SirB N-terminal domain-containing protein [Leptolyngbya sp. FACHB-261]MBD2101149.1 sirohydrochlorin chelatase [Leptolyngbya sp. FACHB-261]